MFQDVPDASVLELLVTRSVSEGQSILTRCLADASGYQNQNAPEPCFILGNQGLRFGESSLKVVTVYPKDVAKPTSAK